MGENIDIKNIAKQIGKNAKKYREEKKYTQKELAGRLKIKDEKIKRLEQGNFSTLNLDLLLNLCSNLGIEISSLFSDTEFIKKFDKDTIQKYQSLPEEKQKIIKLVINILYNKENNINQSRYLDENKVNIIKEIANI